MEQNNLKNKIIEILREVLSASENRDWGREAQATKEEMEIMQNNNDNDFMNITDEILELFEREKLK